MRRAAPRHFDPDWYLAAYPDVARAGVDPVRHYLRHGRFEGRLPCFLVAAGRERDLRQGFLQEGLAGFDSLFDGTDPAERAWARIAAARHLAGRGDWAGAEAHLATLDPETDLTRGFALPDPPLLAIESALVAHDAARARHLLALARGTFGRTPDLALAAANLAAAQAGHGVRWRAALGGLFARAGLLPPAVDAGPGPAFDRLRAPPARPRRGGPLVSVIVPARDAAATLGAALGSLGAQSWRALEVLVVDNGSTDATPEIAQAHAREDPRIRLLDGSAEPGAYPARNIGLAAATGAFITVLDADDWAHPARIALQVQALLRAPDRAASVTHWVRSTPDLRFTRWWGGAGLVHRNVSSLMIRAGLRDRLGYWDRVKAGADTEYFLRIEAICGPGSIAELFPGVPLSFGRVRPDALTADAETGGHSQHYGPRRSYTRAAARWHATTAPDDLPMPRHPARRFFAAPPALAPAEDMAPDTPEDRLAASGLFDARWYMATHADLREADTREGVDEAAHYLRTGAGEGRNPGPAFSSSGYALTQGVTGQNPLLHYLDHGRAAGADPLPDIPGALPAPAPGRHLLFFGHQALEQVFGAERSLLDMLDRAAAAGLTPSVVLPQILNRDYLAAICARAHKVHLRPYGWVHGPGAPPEATVARLAALIRETAAVEVHVNTAVLAAPLVAAARAGVPSVLHARERPDTDRALCLGQGLTAQEWRGLLLARAGRFVANSPGVAGWLAAPERTLIVPNRVDAALFDLPFAPVPPLRVALIGSLVARKGVRDMPALARGAAQRGLPVRFLLIGPDSPDLTALGPLPAGLRHAGYAPDAAAALAQADVVLNLSKVAESFGRTVFEAMAAGRPVICYDRGHPPELVGTEGGTVVPADDTGAVLEALAGLLAPGRLAQVSRAARARARALDDAGRAVPDAALYAAAFPGR